MSSSRPHGVTNRVLAAVGRSAETFDCCDTTFRLTAWGPRASSAVERGVATARRLEAKLDAFSSDSALAELAATGRVVDEDVANVASRALSYLDRTAGRFDPRHGGVERAVKAYVAGDSDEVCVTFDAGSVRVSGAVVESDVRLDLNGLAKGYIVDRTAAALAGTARRGFVDGGGDLSPPPGPVGIENPDEDAPVTVVDTDWAVASSGGYRRGRGDVDHLYDPVAERVGSRHDQVTVVARRDVMEADALATTLSVTPLDDALSLAADWPGLEALVYRDGRCYTTAGFESHALD